MNSWQILGLGGSGLLTVLIFTLRRAFGPDRSSRALRRVRDAAILIVGLTILIPVARIAERLAPDHRDTFRAIIRRLEESTRTGA